MRATIVWSIAVCLGLGLETEADACGLKLTIKSTKINRPVTPSKHPSRVLVLGDSPDALTTALKRAGHNVETAESLDAVRGNDYQVILVSDRGQVQKAQATWGDAEVLAMRSGTTRNLSMLEKALERKPIATRTTQEQRTRIASGPEDERDGRRKVDEGGSDDTERGTPVDSGHETPPAEASELRPEPKPEPVAKKEAPVAEPVAAEPVLLTKRNDVIPTAAVRSDIPTPDRDEQKPSRGAKGPRRVYFSLAGTKLNASAKAGMAKHVNYLRKHTDVSIYLSGHADAVGSNEVNQILSQARVDNAKKYLLSKGIEASRITAEAFGEDRPAVEPSSDPRNRCVAIEIRD